MYSVAIIGAGNIASNYDTPSSKKILTHAHAIIHNDNFVLRGFFDINETTARQAAKKWGSKSFDSIGELSSEADVCVCCVPDSAHYSVINKIVAKKPKLIITEKPLADSLKSAEKIYDLCRVVPVVVNYSRRYIKEYSELKYKLEGFGRLIKGTAYYGKGTFHNGSHIIDLLRFLFGDISQIKRTGIDVKDFPDDVTSDAILKLGDSYVYLIGIDSGAVTIFEADFLFEKSRVRIINGGQRIELYKNMPSNEYEGYSNYVLSRTIEIDYSNALTGLYENVALFLSGKGQLLCTLDDGLEAIKICERIRGG